MFLVRRILQTILLGITLPSLTGCETTGATTAAVAGVGAIYAARSPSSEIHQIYYLGVLDPTGQLPEAFYRVTVRGQASALSGVDFQSGWVPSAFVDSLGSNLQFQPPASSSQEGMAQFSTISRAPVSPDGEASIKVGRKLVLFGPEGFRHAPKDHRLVILMGSDASKFFKAVDSALGTVAEVQSESKVNELRVRLYEALSILSEDRKNVAELEIAAERLSLTAGGRP